MITDFEDGQVENPTQHNTTFIGLPSTGKNHTKCIIEEWGMRGDYIKTIYPHCATPGHLQEILQYTLPNGFFEERTARQQIETVRENLRNAEYTNASLAWEELDTYELLDDDQKIELLDTCLEEATNDQVTQRLRTARRQLEEKRRKGAMIKENLAENYDVPRPIRDVFRDGDGLTTNFSVTVFTPVSFGMPTGTEYPDFFEPFAIPVDDFKRYDMDKSLKIVFGKKNYDGHREIYDQAATVGDTTHADIKAVDVDDLDRDYVQKQEVSGEEIEIYDPGRPTRKVQSFRRKWSQMFDSEGVVCSADFPHQLREKLKAALLDDETDCIVLYTGFLRNSGLKKFVMTYFMQTYRSLLDSLSVKEERNLDRKFVLSFLEAQEAIVKKASYRTLSDQDEQFNAFMHTYANQMRHHNSDLWADAKPDDCHPMLLSRSQHAFVTRVNPEDWSDLFQNRDQHLKDDARAAFMNRDYRELENSKYGMGFILFSEGEVQSWKKSKHAPYFPNTQTYGYRHLAPRQSVQRPVPYANDDPSFFTENLGFAAAGRTITFDEYLEDFREDWEPAEAEPIAVEDKQLEQEQKEAEREEKAKSEMRQEQVCTKLRLMTEQNGIPTTWREYLRDIKEDLELDVTMKSMENWTKETRDELEQQDAEQDVDIDVDEVVRELIRDEKFVFGYVSKEQKQMYAKRVMQEEYDVSEAAAESVIDDVVAEAIAQLKFEGIIGSSFNPQLEGETTAEQKQQFREIMGVNVAEAGDDDPTEEAGDSMTESVSDTRGVADGSSGETLDGPGEAWTCSCGAENAPDRSVCRRCTQPYDDG
jgi:hypothetical protein